MLPYLQGFHYYWLTNFPDFSNIFFQFSSIIFFSILGKIPDWKMLSFFPKSFSPSGNHDVSNSKTTNHTFSEQPLGFKLRFSTQNQAHRGP